MRFRTLFGRRMQLIDCQNLFCETDKYSRVAYPKITGLNSRVKIKQRYKHNNFRKCTLGECRRCRNNREKESKIDVD